MRRMRDYFLMMAFSTSLVAAPACLGANEEGLTTTDLRGLAGALPDLAGRIVSIQIFRDSSTHANSVALLTLGIGSGWQLYVLGSSAPGKYASEWKSGKLDDGFSVSSAEALKIAYVGGEQVVEFSGCAAHVCPDVFSILLYVPSIKTAFTVHYVQGKTTYSSNLNDVANASYKVALENLVRKHKS